MDDVGLGPQGNDATNFTMDMNVDECLDGNIQESVAPAENENPEIREESLENKSTDIEPFTKDLLNQFNQPISSAQGDDEQEEKYEHTFSVDNYETLSVSQLHEEKHPAISIKRGIVNAIKNDAESNFEKLRKRSRKQSKPQPRPDSEEAADTESDSETETRTSTNQRKGFLSSLRLGVSKRTSSRYKSFTCPDCKKSFSRLDHFEAHKLIHNGQLPHQCEHCSLRFRLVSRMRKHMLIHDNKSAECDICHKRYKNRKNMLDHKRHHMDMDCHLCPHCGIKVKTRSTLTTHIMKVHTDERPFSCEFCEKGFIRMSHLKRHLPTHSGERPHSCNICDKRFTQAITLRVHMLVHTKEKNHICSECGKAFARPHDLKMHSLSHNGEKKHFCDICKKGFYTTGKLKRHSLVHSGEKPYMCMGCGKGFGQSQQLRNHECAFTGPKEKRKPEKKLRCSYCDMMFATPSELKRHRITHLDIKPYVCSVCQKGFSRAHSLDIHSRVHSGLKPFDCDFCQKAFTQRCNLMTHIQKKHNTFN